MSDFHIWGLKAHLVLEDKFGTFEVLAPFQMEANGRIKLNSSRVLDAVNEREIQMAASPPPLQRAVLFDPNPS